VTAGRRRPQIRYSVELFSRVPWSRYRRPRWRESRRSRLAQAGRIRVPRARPLADRRRDHADLQRDPATVHRGQRPKPNTNADSVYSTRCARTRRRTRSCRRSSITINLCQRPLSTTTSPASTTATSTRTPGSQSQPGGRLKIRSFANENTRADASGRRALPATWLVEQASGLRSVTPRVGFDVPHRQTVSVAPSLMIGS
jgi:hypothetical protein